MVAPGAHRRSFSAAGLTYLVHHGRLPPLQVCTGRGNGSSHCASQRWELLARSFGAQGRDRQPSPSRPRAVATGPSPLSAGRHDHTLRRLHAYRGYGGSRQLQCHGVLHHRCCAGCDGPPHSQHVLSTLLRTSTPAPRWPGDRAHQYVPKREVHVICRQNRKGGTY